MHRGEFDACPACGESFVARAIITEVGGQVAHLAQVALEKNITVMRVPDACSRYLAGVRVRLEPSEGKIHLHIERT